MRKAPTIKIFSRLKKQSAPENFRDNPTLDRLIEVGTKALRRGLMSGETLRAPRQQLRRLCASAFVLSAKSPAIARLSGARCIFWAFSESISRSSIPLLLSRSLSIQKSVRTIRKNFVPVLIRLITEVGKDTRAPFCFNREKLVA